MCWEDMIAARWSKRKGVNNTHYTHINKRKYTHTTHIQTKKKKPHQSPTQQGEPGEVREFLRSGRDSKRRRVVWDREKREDPSKNVRVET